MLGRPTLLFLIACCFVSPAHGVVTRDCALPASDCTIRDTARQAHVHVGVTTNRAHGPAERAVIATHFNALTAENAMKWGAIAPTVGNYDFTDADAIADFAASAGLRLRGHTLVWGRLQLPTDLAAQVGAAADPAARLRALVAEHMATMTGRYGDRVALWDVVNEPLDVFTDAFDPNLFFQTLGDGYLADAFTLARALDSDAELFVNEFALTYPSAKLAGLARRVADLVAMGVPIDGIGVQAHVFPLLPLPSRESFRATLQTVADVGLPIELTELDVSIWHFRNEPDPLAAQAAYYGDLVGACMAIPQCRAVTVWGLADSESWLDHMAPFDAAAPNAPLLFDAHLAPKPAYFAVRDAIRTRAVPFRQQAATLRLDVRAARRRGAIHGDAVRIVGRTLGRAKRSLGRGGFADACTHLAGAADALALATGSDVAPLAARLATLRADLRCDEP